MKLCELKAFKSANRKKKRIARGAGSGHGKTACRGSKGAKSRSGNEYGILFEGGQMPLFRRLPKRGFNNIFKKKYNIINLKDLNEFEENSTIDYNSLKENRYLKKPNDGVKILGVGELKKPLKIYANKFSKSAIEKIKSAGGEINII